MRKKALNLNGVSPFKAFIIDDAFSEQECDFLLHKVLAKDGFSAEQTNKYGEKWRDDALRNNSSAHIKCKKVAEFLYCRIASHLTGVFGGSIGLNKHLRYNAFQPKETIAPHVLLIPRRCPNVPGFMTVPILQAVVLIQSMSF